MHAFCVEVLRTRRLTLLRQALGGGPFVLCIDETGDSKKGKTTDYVAHQYIWRPANPLYSGDYRMASAGGFASITSRPTLLRCLKTSTWYIMTNLEGTMGKTVGNTYGLRTWIEYGGRPRQK